MKPARTLLALAMLAMLSLWITSLPSYYRQASTLTLPAHERAGQTITGNDVFQAEAAGRGLSLAANALYEIIYNGLLIAAFFGVAGLLIWQAAGRPFVVATALLLMCVGANSMLPTLQRVQTPQAVLILFDVLIWHAWPALFAWIYLFPGRAPAPRWTVAPVAVLIVIFLLLMEFGILAAWGLASPEFDRLQLSVGPPAGLGMLALILYSQVYRYRHVYGTVERQQLKWFLYGIGVLLADVLLFVVLRAAGIPLPRLAQDLSGASLTAIPLSIGIAITRYRLFNIDVIIRRTLIYTVLTALLALVFAGSIVLLQALLAPLLGPQSAVATVLSTLAISVLFGPLRRRVQDTVDRRFYRPKYDAQQVLETFARRARDETDLEPLLAEMENVVLRTLQPSRVGVILTIPHEKAGS